MRAKLTPQQLASLRLPTRKTTKEDWIRRGPLGEFMVFESDFCTADTDKFLKRLRSARRERDMQVFFEHNPALLAKAFASRACRWVIPHKRLGAEYVPDFLVGNWTSMGWHWKAFELENPRAKAFKKDGEPTARLVHAICQIERWRAWLKQNRDYAARPREKQGLGLPDIAPTLPGVVIIGRRRDMDRKNALLRRQLCEDLNIDLRSYDSLAD